MLIRATDRKRKCLPLAMMRRAMKSHGNLCTANNITITQAGFSETEWTNWRDVSMQIRRHSALLLPSGARSGHEPHIRETNWFILRKSFQEVDLQFRICFTHCFVLFYITRMFLIAPFLGLCSYSVSVQNFHIIWDRWESTQKLIKRLPNVHKRNLMRHKVRGTNHVFRLATIYYHISIILYTKYDNWVGNIIIISYRT
jgi:hypothetical protein